MLEDEVIEEVESFIYLGSIIDKQGGTDAYVKIRIGKARAAFLQLKYVWGSRDLSIHTKIRLFNTNIKSILLYGAETWKMIVNITKKIQTLVKKNPPHPLP